MSASGVDIPAATCEGVGFRYGRHVVFNDLTLAIAPGITGLLGPNGAGKTTLLSLVSTQRPPRSGRVIVLGSDAATSRGRESIRRRIGVLSQRFPLVGSMRVLDTVAYAAWAQGLSKQAAYPAAEQALKQLGIADLQGRRCRSLSGGQRQRVGLAAALAHSPDLLILDEPSAGLDPLARMSLRKTLVEVSQRCSVLLSTHLIDDVLTMCPRLVVLNAGEVAFEGPTGGLADLGEGVSTEVSASPLERGYSALLGQQ